jgi:GMP synthase (glutamine-hydrolysing)
MRPRLLVVQHEDDAPLGRLSFPGTEVDVLRPDRGDRLPVALRGPAGASGHDGLVVLGGDMAAWEDDRAPWLPGTRVLLARCVDDGVPVLGVCLGAQLLALATGGRVGRGAAGPELGLSTVHATPAAAGDALLGGLGERWLAPQGHGDAVLTLPPGAVHLAAGQAYPHQAFRVGDAAWGLQYHPEVTSEDLADWMRHHTDVLARRGTSAAAVMAAFDAVQDELLALAAAHGAAFASVVRDASAHRERVGSRP